MSNSWKINQYSRIFNPYLISSLKPASNDLSNIIIITGSPRSGTTWLGELIMNIPKSIMLFEPLNIKRNPKAKEFNFKWRTYINPKNKDPRAQVFFDNLFNCRQMNSWVTSKIPISRLFGMEYIIIKFVRANLLINWLCNNYQFKNKPIFIIRHPCAVVASQLSLQQFSKRKSTVLNDDYIKDYSLNKDILRSCNKNEEILAARWCQENYLPLINKNSSLIYVAYENLLNNPEYEIKKIFDEWNIKIPEKIYSMISTSSSTTYRDEDHENKTKILTNWQKSLDNDQQKRILRVVKEFGMDFYTSEPEPDYARLYSQNPIK